MIAGTAALSLSTLAGLGTVVGGAIVVWISNTRFTHSKNEASLMGSLQGKSRFWLFPLTTTRLLSISILLLPLLPIHTQPTPLTPAMSAGVMLFMSFFDIMPESWHHISVQDSVLMFFLGMLLIRILELVFPESWLDEWASGSRIPSTVVSPVERVHRKEMMRTGLVTFIGMALHNAPEGVAVYVSTLRNQTFGASLAFAIACHNIPEGMAVAIPLLIATQNPRETLKWTLINGLFEPMAVLLCCLIFGWSSDEAAISEVAVSQLLAMVAGIMTYISLSELYPSSLKQCEVAEAGSVIRGKDQAMLMLVIGMLIGYVVLVTFGDPS